MCRWNSRSLSSPTTDTNEVVEVTLLARRWTLRILLRLGGHREHISCDYFQDDWVARAVGIQAWLGVEPEAFIRNRIREQLRQDLMLAEAEPQQDEWPQQLSSSIDRLAKLVGVGEIECPLLGFSAILS